MLLSIVHQESALSPAVANSIFLENDSQQRASYVMDVTQ